jgi:hypothetical protein
MELEIVSVVQQFLGNQHLGIRRCSAIALDQQSEWEIRLVDHGSRNVLEMFAFHGAHEKAVGLNKNVDFAEADGGCKERSGYRIRQHRRLIKAFPRWPLAAHTLSTV